MPYAFARFLGIRVIGWEYTRNWIAQNLVPIGRFGNIISDAIQPPPDRIAAIEPWLCTIVQEVRYEAMTQTSRKSKNRVPSFIIATS